jgi:hypothetical protein
MLASNRCEGEDANDACMLVRRAAAVCTVG